MSSVPSVGSSSPSFTLSHRIASRVQPPVRSPPEYFNKDFFRISALYTAAILYNPYTHGPMIYALGLGTH